MIIIPAYNEEQAIGAVIENLKKHGYSRILVVDDGSTDKTSEIVSATGVEAVRHLFNSGLGTSLSTGFEIAKILNPEIVVTYDADAQHDPGDIEKLVEPIQKGEADVVIGSRIFSIKDMPWKRIIYNKIANFITFAVYGFSLSDTQSGLRAFSRKAYNAINIDSTNMECSSEIVHKIEKNKLIYKEVRVKAIYTDYSLSKGQNFGRGVKTFASLVLDRLTGK